MFTKFINAVVVAAVLVVSLMGSASAKEAVDVAKNGEELILYLAEVQKVAEVLVVNRKAVSDRLWAYADNTELVKDSEWTRLFYVDVFTVMSLVDDINRLPSVAGLTEYHKFYTCQVENEAKWAEQAYWGIIRQDFDLYAKSRETVAASIACRKTAEALFKEFTDELRAQSSK